MIKISRFLFWLGVFCLAFAMIIVANAFAYDRDVHAEWTKYTGPIGATITGFNLYQDGLPTCKFPGKDAISGDCTVNLTKLDTSFTLAAIFSDSKESPQSAPFVLRDYGPAPQGLKVVVTIRTVSTLTRYGNPTSRTTITRKEVAAGTVVQEGTSGYYNSKTREYITNTVIAIN